MLFLERKYGKNALFILLHIHYIRLKSEIVGNVLISFMPDVIDLSFRIVIDHLQSFYLDSVQVIVYQDSSLYWTVQGAYHPLSFFFLLQKELVILEQILFELLCFDDILFRFRYRISRESFSL